MKRRFVNLVTRRYAEIGSPKSEDVFSVRRIDPHHHFFYGSARAALEAAEDAAKKKKKEPFCLQLPSPVMNFADKLDMFAHLGRDRMVYANRIGGAGLYDADMHAHSTLPRLHTPKRFKPVCLSIARRDDDGEDSMSMYVLDRYAMKDDGRCFEVLEPSVPPELRGMWTHSPWRWWLLPPPPFIREAEYEPCHVTSFATVVDGDGRSTIYISCDGGIGTYSFDTASSRFFSRSPAGSEGWSHVGEWKLPFVHRAQYVPEFNLWFGFLASSPNHLCAVDLSAAAMDREPGRPPTVKQVWHDLDPPEGEEWFQVQLELVDLGDGKFLIAKTFEAAATSDHFTVLTGVEMMMAGVGGDQSIQMVKHKSARFVLWNDHIEWVL